MKVFVWKFVSNKTRQALPFFVLKWRRFLETKIADLGLFPQGSKS